MKKIAIIAALVAAPAVAQEAEQTVTQFNGHSLTILSREVQISGAEDASKPRVQERADQVCSSSGKSAELEARQRIDGFQVQYFYLCL
ncbi:hypothetical protein [Roseivivax isoporae]|uniref:UrcA family protein n=1 Tax=Roseivivax isoporae LMG 25204 TaxID=1449351 RepID=X7F113_9RHOB|nr:hypothetical protein [Roseivivax isoporae]ETX26567.1 hypothetical protein RISW2_22020 [Roseivivax isoporae LMG 25204]